MNLGKSYSCNINFKNTSRAENIKEIKKLNLERKNGGNIFIFWNSNKLYQTDLVLDKIDDSMSLYFWEEVYSKLKLK